MGLLHSRSRSQKRFKMSVNVCPDDIFSVCRSCPLNISRTAQSFFMIFFLPNLVWWCIIMRRCVVRKNWFTIFSVKVTARAYVIKIWHFLLCLLTAGPFATKLSLIVQHHKLQCPAGKWDYFVQGQGHNEVQNVSECVCSICSEPQNFLLPNLIWLCSIISQSVSSTPRSQRGLTWSKFDCFCCIF